MNKAELVELLIETVLKKRRPQEFTTERLRELAEALRDERDQKLKAAAKRTKLTNPAPSRKRGRPADPTKQADRSAFAWRYFEYVDDPAPGSRMSFDQALAKHLKREPTPHEKRDFRKAFAGIPDAYYDRPPSVDKLLAHGKPEAWRELIHQFETHFNQRLTKTPSGGRGLAQLGRFAAGELLKAERESLEQSLADLPIFDIAE